MFREVFLIPFVYLNNLKVIVIEKYTWYDTREFRGFTINLHKFGTNHCLELAYVLKNLIDIWL